MLKVEGLVNKCRVESQNGKDLTCSGEGRCWDMRFDPVEVGAMALADVVFNAINRPSEGIESQIDEKEQKRLVFVNPNIFSICFCLMS